ncbi:hypothetical protein MJO28_013301, partial [Puccinia striiformis f. sp. tritici]
MEQCTGLAIYLFILGELCDSLLNQTMSHFDCIYLREQENSTDGSSSQNFMVLDVRQMMPKIFIIVKSIMSGRVKMPKWDHIHSGDFHLSCHFYYAERSDNQIALKEFPTNKQIAKLLKLAEKQAETLIKFTGMQKVPGVESSQSSTGLSVNNVISPSAHKYIMLTTNTSDDVLFSITKQYYFKSPRAHNNHRQTNELEDAFSEAVLIAVSNTQIPMSIVNVFNFEHQSSRKWVTPTHELHQDNLICHCHDHDSRIQLHHRNERKRCQNIVKSNSSESIDKLDAKSCSKIVAICLLIIHWENPWAVLLQQRPAQLYKRVFHSVKTLIYPCAALQLYCLEFCRI